MQLVLTLTTYLKIEKYMKIMFGVSNTKSHWFNIVDV